jgi:hypothetical protein
MVEQAAELMARDWGEMGEKRDKEEGLENVSPSES